MLENINEENIRKIIRKELEKYFSQSEAKAESKESIIFLGVDEELKQELAKKFILSDEAETLIASNLTLKNLFNISNGIYENDFEEKIVKQTLKNKKVVFIEEGFEHMQYGDIPKKLLDKYNSYIENIKEYGIKIQKKSNFLKQTFSKEEIYVEKLLDYKKIKDLHLEGIDKIVLENTIVTSSAVDYAKENNITIVKRR